MREPPVVPEQALAEEAEAVLEAAAESVAPPRLLVARATAAAETIWVAPQPAPMQRVLVSAVSELPIRAHCAVER